MLTLILTQFRSPWTRPPGHFHSSGQKGWPYENKWGQGRVGHSIQRFGGSLNLNIHFHMLFLDGVYTFENETPRFFVCKPTTTAEIKTVVHQITRRVIRFLEKRGYLVRDQESMYFATDESEEAGLSQLQGSSITYRVALGSNQGQKAPTLKSLAPSKAQR